MADLQFWANVAEIAGLITVAGGLFFAILQIRASRAQRHHDANMALLTTFMTDEHFVPGARRIIALPDDWHLRPEFMEDESLHRSIQRVYMLGETLALLVFNRALTLRQALHAGADVFVPVWAKLRPHAEQVRREQGRDGPFEWLQWLAETIERYTPPHDQQPAFIRYRDWRPRRSDIDR